MSHYLLGLRIRRVSMRRMMGASVMLLWSLFSAGCTERGRQFTDREIHYAGAYWHGVGSLPDSLRNRIVRDTALIQHYGDLLEGRATSSVKWDTSTVLWWLAESGDPKYVPIFLKYADPDLYIGVFTMAVYGLARHASLPTAGQRLRELGAIKDPLRRYQVANLLMYVNDEAARAILRAVSTWTKACGGNIA